MAFHQPTRQSVQRVVRQTEQHEAPSNASRAQQDGQVDEFQTWVLFSPATEATATSYLCETERSLETPGRSRVSALGSLETAPRTEEYDGSGLGAQTSILDVEDDAELDSLDSHLPGFRSVPGHHDDVLQEDQALAQPVFPGHDGLGSFRLDHPVHGIDAQEQMYQFEKYNPRKAQRPEENVDRGQAHLEQPGLSQESEKREWIEAWRLEHSRVLLDEVRRETRKRRLSQSTQHGGLSRQSSQMEACRDTAESDDTRWHDEDAVSEEKETEGFLARLSRKVRDILGIDDRMLAILIGDALPDEDDLSATPTASRLDSNFSQTLGNEDWQLRVLEKVSKELGYLVNHLSHHPGAFSTFNHIQQMHIPYAGLPAIPESTSMLQQAHDAPNEQSNQPAQPQFKPSLPQAAQPIKISSHRPATPQRDEHAVAGTFTREEWQQDLDINLVFRYLRSRFTSRKSSSSSAGYSSAASGQDTAAKAARVRQHHPLVSRSRSVNERRTFKNTTPNSSISLRHGHASSCASQSTKRSARRSSVSSRHYWDVGGSLGTGSVIASNGPMGSWGEV